MLVSQDGQDLCQLFCCPGFSVGFCEYIFLFVLGWFCFILVSHCFNSFICKAFSFLPNIPHFWLKKVLEPTLMYGGNIIKTSGFFRTKHIWDGNN